MDLNTIENWLIEVQTKMPEILCKPAKPGWWPPSTGAPFTNFATAVLLRAASEVCSNVKLILHANGGKKGTDAAIIGAFIAKNGHFKLSNGTVVVDFSVQNPKAADPFEFSAESEVGNHDVGDDYMISKNDYAWDFFKLLTLPSRNRFFFAVIHGKKKDAYKRCKKLTKNLIAIYQKHGPALVRPGDRIAIVVVPKASEKRDKTWVCSINNGTILFQQISRKFS